jgi:hypothetical protein
MGVGLLSYCQFACLLSYLTFVAAAAQSLALAHTTIAEDDTVLFSTW